MLTNGTLYFCENIHGSVQAYRVNKASNSIYGRVKIQIDAIKTAILIIDLAITLFRLE